MGLLAFSMADAVLWTVAVAVAATLFSGMMVRRRTLYTDTLRDYVRRQQSGDSAAGGPPADTSDPTES